MTYASRPVASMSHPDRWIAFLRIVVGLYFAKAVYTKLGLVMVGGVLPLPGASERWIHTMKSSFVLIGPSGLRDTIRCGANEVPSASSP